MIIHTPRPFFSAIDTPLCPRFMPRPRAFFRKLKARDLLHDIGAASPVAPDFSVITAASDACEFRRFTSSRGDNPPSSGASIGDAPRFMGGLI